jgi:hypothetical protein
MTPAALPLLTCLLLTLSLHSANAQSYCASDGQPRPVQLLERFINADCDSCWADPATPKPGAGAIALDWIVPGAKGDDAPLAAASSRRRRGPPAPATASRRCRAAACAWPTAWRWATTWAHP